MELQTTTQAGKRLGESPKVVRRYVKQGRLVPAVVVPGPRGALLFDPAAVDRLAAELADEAEARAAALRGGDAA